VLQLARSTFAAVLVTAVAVAIAQEPAPQGPPPKVVELQDLKSKNVGRVMLLEAPHGLLFAARCPGFARHPRDSTFTRTGKCEPPFKTAGGHFNPEKKAHGVLDPGGSHAGDLPNLLVPASGKLDFELFAPGLTLGAGPSSVLDADGTALVIHAKADDYRTQPAGDSGDRIAAVSFPAEGRVFPALMIFYASRNLKVFADNAGPTFSEMLVVCFQYQLPDPSLDAPASEKNSSEPTASIRCS
jgi:Cu-Zn family superoxide dismutase